MVIEAGRVTKVTSPVSATLSTQPELGSHVLGYLLAGVSFSAPSCIKSEVVVCSSPIVAFTTWDGVGMSNQQDDHFYPVPEGGQMRWLKRAGFGITQTWVQIPTLPLTG